MIRANILKGQSLMFFPIPKTGCTSILWEDGKLSFDPCCGHVFAIETKARHFELWESCLTFSIVRHPLDRLVSLWAYLRMRSSTISKKNGPEEFILVKARQCKQFRNFVLWLQEVGVGVDRHFYPQWRWICDESGEVLIDFVGRFELLQEDWNRVCTAVGYKCKVLPRLKASRHAPFQEVYDDKSRQIVSQLYRRDIELFGYGETHDNSSDSVL